MDIDHNNALPERAALALKVTYLERKKRKRTMSNHDEGSNSDSSEQSKSTTMSPRKNIATNNAKKTPSKTPVSKGPKKVDVRLPGPSPKRARHDSGDSENLNPKSAPAPTKKISHARSMSSISALKQVAKKVAESPGSKAESVSTPIQKPKSKAKSLPGDDDDDNVSIADSSISVVRVRRNEAERLQYFENQPECAKIEAHSAHCSRCGKTVSLGRKQTYAVRPWEIHRARCDLKPAIARDHSSPATPRDEVVRPSEPPSPTKISGSTSSITNPRRPTEQERLTILQGEKWIEKIEKHRVLCRKCKQWIESSQTTNTYTSSDWLKHRKQCCDAVPSNRVASAKRRLALVNDPQAKTYDAQKVTCNFCGTVVQLEGEGDHNLRKWNEHKGTCKKSIPLSKGESTSSVVFPSISTRPPNSSASTESTLVVDGNLSRPQGAKRPREETESTAQEDERKSVRPRTMSYLPPDIEPPSSVLGWFMLPFNSFVRGFKESLRDRP